MELQGIKSTDLSVGDLLKDFYVVPDYQREYIWTVEDVDFLIHDVHDAQTTSNSDESYFIGTIVTNFNSEPAVYELVDGQQRVTTLYVALIAIRDFLREIGTSIEKINDQLHDNAVDRFGQETPRYRVELQYDDSQNVLVSLVNRSHLESIDAIEHSTLSATNLLNAYSTVRTFLQDALKGDESAVRKFYAFLTQSVKLIRIQTDSIDRALWIFETINARGRGLDAMDLLKNLLFRHARGDDFERLKQRWKSLVDTLHAAGERPMVFIRYFLLAKYAERQIRSDEVYRWMTDEKNQSRPHYWLRPVEFATELLSAAQAYSRFAAGLHEDGSTCEPLRNIRRLSSSTRQHLIVMLAARSLPKKDVENLASELEKLFCVFVLTRVPANRYESLLVEWAIILRRAKSQDDLAQFLHLNLVPRRQEMSRDFDVALRIMRANKFPKYRLKYILARMAFDLDSRAYGQADMKQYLDRMVDIEHILSQRPSQEQLSKFGNVAEAKDAINRLANLTLLERSLNATLQNGDFQKKAATYAKSRFLLTKSLVPGAQVGDQTAVNRTIADLKSYEDWTPESMNDRENRLVALARRIWGTSTERESE